MKDGGGPGGGGGACLVLVSLLEISSLSSSDSLESSSLTSSLTSSSSSLVEESSGDGPEGRAGGKDIDARDLLPAKVPSSPSLEVSATTLPSGKGISDTSICDLALLYELYTFIIALRFFSLSATSLSNGDNNVDKDGGVTL
jgi:hypothetical protein